MNDKPDRRRTEHQAYVDLRRSIRDPDSPDAARIRRWLADRDAHRTRQLRWNIVAGVLCVILPIAVLVWMFYLMTAP